MLYVSPIINSIISAVFFISFYMKVKSIPTLKCEIYSYRLLKNDFISISSYLLLAIELLLSISFIFNLFGFLKNIFCIGLLLFFCFILIRKKKQEEIDRSDCSCFGEMKFMNKYPLIRNIVLIFILITQTLLPSYSFSSQINLILLLIIMQLIVYYDLLIQTKRGKYNYI
ncbi:MauE/DoxX family redox-associated membrane protein [Bacillus sp. SM2101]|uniref:MauE/DoxX family redox-associated membrane protein n=1 Tax=Bacillus sp. SM2101 TaxID=2805366 RepID=UPI00332E5B4C